MFFKWKENRQHIFESVRFYFITIVISIFLFIIIILSQIKLYILDYEYSLWYDFFLFPLLGSCGFAFLLKEKKTVKMRCLFTEISKRAFGIYLVHELIISFVVVELLNLIPKIRYLL